MKAYITKYALTQGVFAVDAELCDESMIKYRPVGSRYDQYAHGKDFYFCEEDAIARAEIMREKKIASLRAQIAKIGSIVFEVAE